MPLETAYNIQNVYKEREREQEGEKKNLAEIWIKQFSENNKSEWMKQQQQ